MEPSGRNQWQRVANPAAARTAGTRQDRCRGLRPVAGEAPWQGGGRPCSGRPLASLRTPRTAQLPQALNSATSHPAHIPHEGAGSSRTSPRIPARAQGRKTCSRPESPAIPAQPGSAMTGLFTPEVAGSSPVAPVKYLQIGMFCCRARRRRPPACFHPAQIPHGNPRTKPVVAADPRKGAFRPG